jgi:hypothetical protein
MSESRHWWFRVILDDMRSAGEPFVCHSEFTLRVPGESPKEAACLLERALQRLVDEEAKRNG